MSQSEKINAIVINITLDGPNYLEWSFCVETALRGVGLHSHLTDDPPTLKSDGSNAAAVKSWEISDGKVMAAMVNSVKPTMIMSLRKFRQAKPMWSYLKGRYVSGALQHTLMQQLHVIEQRDMSIDDYYSAFDRLMGSLISMVPQCTAGQTCTTLSFIEQFLTYRFVMGLRAEFDSIRTRLLHTSTLTMAQALSELLAEETRLQSLSSSVSQPHSVLATSHRKTSTTREPCQHCGKNTHSSDACFAKYPEKLAEFRARRAARGRGTSSTPRGSGGSGSVGSVSVAATSSTTAPSSSWVLDSGASFHVTSDSSSLVSCKPVTDGACVQTADGTSCPITHKGSLCNTHFAVPNVSYVPQLSMNLLSVGQVTDQNCFVGFDDSSCFIQDRRSGQVIGTGHRRKGASSLYVLDTLRLPSSVGSPASVSSAALSSASSFAKWHHRLGHLCGSRLSSLINQGC